MTILKLKNKEICFDDHYLACEHLESFLKSQKKRKIKIKEGIHDAAILFVFDYKNMTGYISVYMSESLNNIGSSYTFQGCLMKTMDYLANNIECLLYHGVCFEVMTSYRS